MPPNARFGARPSLIAVTVALVTIGSYYAHRATRGDTTTADFITDASTIDSPPPDSPPDTPPIDTPPDTLAPTTWTLETIYGPESTVGIDGADGVDTATIGGKLTVIVPWEQSGTISVSTLDGTWSTVTLATVTNVEDAKFCDVDQDGNLDVLAGGQGKRIKIWFGPAPWSTTIEIDAATNNGAWMQLACTTPTSKTFTADAGTDVITATAHGWSTGDLVRTSSTTTLPGNLSAATDYFVIRTGADTLKAATSRANALAGTAIDISSAGTGTHTASGGMRVWAGGRPATGANGPLVYLYSGTPRTSSAWTMVTIAQTVWVMSVVPGDFDADGDLDVLISDRTASGASGIKGSKWYEFESGGTWTTNNIYNFNGQGDPKFLYLENSTTVLIGGGSSTRPNKLVRSVTADGWATWTNTEITYPANTGWYQGVLPCDVTGDSNADYVYTHSAATGSLEGVVLIENRGAGATASVDFAAGEKYDNALCLDIDGDGDLDILTSEQNVGLGLIWFRNPRLHL